MPLDPRTWSQFDQVTATRLNGDLYAFQAQQFLPTGVGFHARKPLYKATQSTTGLSVNAGAWRGMFQSGGANVLVDNSGYYGAQMDPNDGGTIADAIAYSNGNPNLPQGKSGNLIGGGGGWYLTSAFAPLGGSAGNLYRVNIANGFTGTTPNLTGTGTSQNGNNNRDTAPFVVDLINYDGGSYTPVIQNQGSSAAPLRTNIDGSGETCYFAAHWVSVNTQYGFTAALPNPKATWGTADTVTASLLNGSTGIRDVLRVLNMPPCLRVTSAASTTCPNNASTTINLGTASLDTYAAYSNGTNTYTVPFGGLFFAYGAVAFQSSGSNVPARCGINVNGTVQWGPWSSMPAGNDNAVAKLAMLDLHAGDTVKLVGQQNSGASLGTATAIPPVLILVWMTRTAAPSPVPSLPDLSYRYPAGMGSAATFAAFNNHLANDLNFLTQKPLLLATQQSGQSIAQTTNTQLTMDTLGGLVHNTAGDPWGGWDATHHRYVAPVSGWYLATMEVFFGAPSLTVTPSTVALFQISTNGSAQAAWDYYQHMNLSVSNNPGGAAGMGYYLLRAGDWITPGVITQDTAAGNLSTYVAGPNSHFECVWVSEG